MLFSKHLICFLYAFKLYKGNSWSEATVVNETGHYSPFAGLHYRCGYSFTCEHLSVPTTFTSLPALSLGRTQFAIVITKASIFASVFKFWKMSKSALFFISTTIETIVTNLVIIVFISSNFLQKKRRHLMFKRQKWRVELGYVINHHILQSNCNFLFLSNGKSNS